MAIWRASLETRNFDFEAYGKTQAAAIAALVEGLARHCGQYGVDVGRMYHPDDIECRAVKLGVAYRDSAEIAE